MTEFPAAAVMGKRILKAKFRGKLDKRLLDLFQTVVWSYALKEDKVQLAKTDEVLEIDVMDLTLREECKTLRQLAELVSGISTAFKNPVILRVYNSDGTERCFALNLKKSSGALCGDSPIFRLFYSKNTDIPLPKGVGTFASFLKNFAASLAGLVSPPEETLEELAVRSYDIEVLKKQLSDLDRKLKKEEHTDAKFHLAKERRELAGALERLRQIGYSCK